MVAVAGLFGSLNRTTRRFALARASASVETYDVVNADMSRRPYALMLSVFVAL